MNENDGYWADYYTGTPDEITFQKIFSYSDRIRYYWTDPAIAAALNQLLHNLGPGDLPAPLVSQFFAGFEFGHIPLKATDLINSHIRGKSVVNRFLDLSQRIALNCDFFRADHFICNSLRYAVSGGA